MARAETLGIVLSVGTVIYQYLLQGTTLHRVVLHVAPLAAFWVAVMLGCWGRR